MIGNRAGHVPPPARRKASATISVTAVGAGPIGRILSKCDDFTNRLHRRLVSWQIRRVLLTQERSLQFDGVRWPKESTIAPQVVIAIGNVPTPLSLWH